VLAYQSDALRSAVTGLEHGSIFHPTTNAVFYDESAWGALPFFLPVFVASENPTLALNVTLLASLALTAWTLHLVIVRWTGVTIGGVVAAWMFLMTPWVLRQFVLCAPSHAIVFYFPAIIALAARSIRSRAETWGLGVLVALQSLSNPYVATAVLAPLLGVIAIRVGGALLAASPAAAELRRRNAAQLATVVACALLVLLVAHSGQIAVRFANPALSEQTHWPRTVDRRRTELPFGPLGQGTPTGVPIAGLIVIGVAALCARGPRSAAAPSPLAHAWRHATYWAVVGTTISLTPVVLWRGEPLRLPHALLHDLTPIYEMLRAPKRLGIAGLMGLCLLSGLAVAEVRRRLSAAGATRAATPVTWALAAVVIVGAYVGIPPRSFTRALPATTHALAGRPHSAPQLRLRPAPRSSPRVIEWLRSRPGPVLELPVRTRGLAGAITPHVEAMYRAIFHRQPILNGYHGYWPAAFPARMTLAARLPDADALAALRRETGVATVLVHVANLSAPARVRWERLANAGAGDGLRLLAREDDVVVFAVEG
jgi:hypothetical protein